MNAFLRLVVWIFEDAPDPRVERAYQLGMARGWRRGLRAGAPRRTRCFEDGYRLGLDVAAAARFRAKRDFMESLSDEIADAVRKPE